MMNYLCKVLFLTIAICIVTVKLNAQTTNEGKITAKVTDASNNETVPFASAMVIDRKTKAVVKGAQTDADGNLIIAGIPNGVYTFKLSYVGFQTMVRDSISISSAANTINLGTIKMKASKGTVLNEVSITAQKSTMQLGIDKKVFSVDQSLVSEGGSASDLLQNVPSVQTDIDGNVSLRGSSGVRVLIDGKPSLIAGGNVAQILQSLPASSIESVELITNPSAKYDAEGQSGIINIVLKKNKKLGFNGSVALTAGSRENYNASTSLSFQNKKINIYGNYSYRYGNRLGGGYNNITYLDGVGNITRYADQLTDSRSNENGHNLKGGIDYYVTDRSVLSFTAGFNNRNNDQKEGLSINKLSPARNPIELSNRINNNTGTGGSYDLALDFSHKFNRPKEEITFNFSFSEGDNDNIQLYNTNIYNIDGTPVNTLPIIQNNNRWGINRNYNIQTDYTLPIGKSGKIEAGYRSQIRFAESSTYADAFNNLTGNFDMDLALSNEFDNKDQVHALYINYQNQINNFGYQVGLRGEDATLDTRMGMFTSSGLQYTPGKVAYTRLYPSVFLTQKFKGEQQVQLNYSRRVNRPRGWDTNPFLDVSDPLNYRQGNPNLQPEDIHAFELGYSKFWSKVTFTSSLYLRKTNDVIQRVRTDPDEQGITITTPQNLTSQLNSGLELISRVDVVKAWNFTANVNLYQSSIKGVPAYGILENSGFSWNANLTNNFVLPYSITVQLKGDYRAPEVMAQGKRNAMYAIDAGAKYDFKNKKSSLSLNVRDVFNTRAWSMTTEANNTIIDFRRRMQGTMANLTFSYRFGKNDFNFKKNKKPDQEMNSGEESF